MVANLDEVKVAESERNENETKHYYASPSVTKCKVTAKCTAPSKRETAYRAVFPN